MAEEIKEIALPKKVDDLEKTVIRIDEKITWVLRIAAISMTYSGFKELGPIIAKAWGGH